MTTAKDQYQKHLEKLHPYLNEVEFGEYLENGITVEGVLQIASKRRAKGAELRDNFQKEKFPYVTEEEYKKLLDEGKSYTSIVSMNDERKQEVEQLRRKFSLSVNISFRPSCSVGILLMGLSGEGKCSTASTLMNQEQGTRRESYKGEFNGKSIVATILQEEEQVGSKEGINYPDLCTNGIHAFFFVVNISNHRVLNQQKMIWDNLKRRLGYSFCKYCILVLTHAELTLKDDTNIDKIYDIYTTKGNPLGQVMQELYPRIVAVNNLTSNSFFRRSQQETLWSMIDQVIIQTRRPYQVNMKNENDLEDAMLTEDDCDSKKMPEKPMPLYEAFMQFIVSLRATFRKEVDH